MKKIGLYLKICRQRAGLTQTYVSDQIGLTSCQFVSKIERGLCRPSRAHLAEYAEVVKCDKDKLMALYLEEFRKKLREDLSHE